MDKEKFKTIMEFYKLLNALYSIDIVNYPVYTTVIECLLDKMLYLYENGDPLDKCY